MPPADKESQDSRLVRVETIQDAVIATVSKLERRIESIENDHAEQIGILAKLSQTVDTLAETVSTLSELTKDLDKGQEVVKARFNIIIGILSTIGIAVITGVVKILFFDGAG